MDDTPPNIHLWNTSFHNFILNGKFPPESFTLLEHVISMKTESTRYHVVTGQHIKLSLVAVYQM